MNYTNAAQYCASLGLHLPHVNQAKVMAEIMAHLPPNTIPNRHRHRSWMSFEAGYTGPLPNPGYCPIQRRKAIREIHNLKCKQVVDPHQRKCSRKHRFLCVQ